MLDRLGQSFSLARYDQRCTGISEPGADLSLCTLVDDLEAVADAAGLDRFPIFAASQGVPVAVAFAVRRPERVTKLVLYGGYAQGRAVRGIEEERQNAEAALTLIRQGWGRSGSAFATAFATIYLPNASKEELQSMVEMQLASATPENVVTMRLAIDKFDVTALLPRVSAPTLVVHAREDSVQFTHWHKRACWRAGLWALSSKFSRAATTFHSRVTLAGPRSCRQWKVSASSNNSGRLARVAVRLAAEGQGSCIESAGGLRLRWKARLPHQATPPGVRPF